MAKWKTINTVQQGVIEFRNAMGLEVGEYPQMLTPDEYELHVKLIQEEFDEIKRDIRLGDIVGVVDGIGDLIYILYGMASHMGIDMTAIHQHIQEANMTKLDENGKPIYNEYGKVIKPQSFRSPNEDIEKTIDFQYEIRQRQV